MREAIAHAVDRRTLLRLALLAAVEKLPAKAPARPDRPARKVVLVTIAGVRRKETLAATGPDNIPHLRGELMPQELFYENCVNEGYAGESLPGPTPTARRRWHTA
jgi:hypothetical protein